MARPVRTNRIDWKGAKVTKQLARAARRGLDETMAACVKAAIPNTPWITHTLQRSIKFEPAKVSGSEVEADWGSFDANYAIYIEEGLKGGTARVRSHRRRSRRGKTASVRAHSRKVSPRAGVKMLQNAADKEYPGLAKRIRKHWEAGL